MFGNDWKFDERGHHRIASCLSQVFVDLFQWRILASASRWGRQPLSLEQKPVILQALCRTLHENKRNCPGGGVPSSQNC